MPKPSIFTGNYAKAFFSDTIPVTGSLEEEYFKKIFDISKNEALSVYSFRENRMVFAEGYEELFKLEKKDVNLATLNELYDEPFNTFKNEYHDRALLHIYNNNKNLDTFSSSFIFTNKDCTYPLKINVKVFQTDARGNLISTVGKITESEEIRTSDIVQYSFNGDFSSDFMFQMNHQLDFRNCISEKSILIMKGIIEGLTISEISHKLSYTVEATNKAIEELSKRFNLSLKKDYIEFSEKNYLLPSQFTAL